MKKPRYTARPLPAAIALGIIAAGGLVFWAAMRERPAGDMAAAAPEASAPVPPPLQRQGQPAARVGGEVVTTADIERQAAAEGLIAPGDRLAPGDETYERILQELVDQKLLAMEAAARGLDEAPEAQRRLDTARERILGNVLVETVVSQAVTDEAIQRMYEEQVRLVEMGDEVRARHILVETREEAEALRGRLAEGADFAELALEASIDEATRTEGGDLGYFTADTMAGPLATAAYATSIGEVSEPVETEFGWHLVKVEDRRATQQPSYESLRPRIVRFMTFDTIQALLGELRENTEIEMLEPEIPPAAPADAAPDPDLADPLEEFVDSIPPNPAAMTREEPEPAPAGDE